MSEITEPAEAPPGYEWLDSEQRWVRKTMPTDPRNRFVRIWHNGSVDRELSLCPECIELNFDDERIVGAFDDVDATNNPCDICSEGGR